MFKVIHESSGVERWADRNRLVELSGYFSNLFNHEWQDVPRTRAAMGPNFYAFKEFPGGKRAFELAFDFYDHPETWSCDLKDSVISLQAADFLQSPRLASAVLRSRKIRESSDVNRMDLVVSMSELPMFCSGCDGDAVNTDFQRLLRSVTREALVEGLCTDALSSFNIGVALLEHLPRAPARTPTSFIGGLSRLFSCETRSPVGRLSPEEFAKCLFVQHVEHIRQFYDAALFRHIFKYLRHTAVDKRLAEPLPACVLARCCIGIGEERAARQFFGVKCDNWNDRKTDLTVDLLLEQSLPLDLLNHHHQCAKLMKGVFARWGPSELVAAIRDDRQGVRSVLNAATASTLKHAHDELCVAMNFAITQQFDPQARTLVQVFVGTQNDPPDAALQLFRQHIVHFKRRKSPYAFEQILLYLEQKTPKLDICEVIRTCIANKMQERALGFFVKFGDASEACAKVFDEGGFSLLAIADIPRRARLVSSLLTYWGGPAMIFAALRADRQGLRSVLHSIYKDLDATVCAKLSDCLRIAIDQGDNEIACTMVRDCVSQDMDPAMAAYEIFQSKEVHLRSPKFRKLFEELCVYLCQLMPRRGIYGVAQACVAHGMLRDAAVFLQKERSRSKALNLVFDAKVPLHFLADHPRRVWLLSSLFRRWSGPSKASCVIDACLDDWQNLGLLLSASHWDTAIGRMTSLRNALRACCEKGLEVPGRSLLCACAAPGLHTLVDFDVPFRWFASLAECGWPAPILRGHALLKLRRLPFEKLMTVSFNDLLMPCMDWQLASATNMKHFLRFVARWSKALQKHLKGLSYTEQLEQEYHKGRSLAAMLKCLPFTDAQLRGLHNQELPQSALQVIAFKQSKLMTDSLSGLRGQVDGLEMQNQTLRWQVSGLEGENRKLRSQLADLKEELGRVGHSVRNDFWHVRHHLQMQVARLDRRIDEQIAEREAEDERRRLEEEEEEEWERMRQQEEEDHWRWQQEEDDYRAQQEEYDYYDDDR